MTQQEEANRLRMSKRPVSMETRRFAAIRLAASSTSLNQELSRMIRNAREENARRGGWVRIFPTAETWPTYGSMLEFSSPNNQILHEHLFPEAARKHAIRTGAAGNRRPKPSSTSSTANKPNINETRKRSQSAGPGREKLVTPNANESPYADQPSSHPKPVPKREKIAAVAAEMEQMGCNGEEGENENEKASTSTTQQRPRTSSGAVIMSSSSSSGIGSMTSSEDDIASDTASNEPSPQQTISAKPSACELRVAQYEKPLTKGHCPIKKSKDPDQKDPEKIAKKRSERRERSHMLKEKIVKLIEGGLQLSEYQARKAFSVYLHCILQRLSDFDDAKDDSSQIELVLKFLQKASLSLREPYIFKAPSCKLSGKDRAAIVAKDLNEFLAHYRRETEFFTVFREEQGMVPRHIFEEFIAFAHDSDLEDVLTLQTKLYRCAHIFLGKCLPPVTGRKNSLLRTAYGISPDRNLRDKQCSMRVNARANPPVAPQFTLPSQPPSKCLDISTKKDASSESEETPTVDKMSASITAPTVASSSRRKHKSSRHENQQTENNSESTGSANAANNNNAPSAASAASTNSAEMHDNKKAT